MPSNVNIDRSQFDQLLKELKDLPEEVAQEAGKYYKRITPRLSGNAQSKTYTKGKSIKSDYAYAGRLDDGYSKQAPRGMSEPTINYIKELVERQAGRL